MKSFRNKIRFYSNSKHFCVVQNSFPFDEKLTNINHKKNAKTISTFDFSTLYTAIPNNPLLKGLKEIISFAFNHKKKIGAGFSESLA